jgi:hypothetical protein
VSQVQMIDVPGFKEVSDGEGAEIAVRREMVSIALVLTGSHDRVPPADDATRN